MRTCAALPGLAENQQTQCDFLRASLSSPDNSPVDYIVLSHLLSEQSVRSAVGQFFFVLRRRRRDRLEQSGADGADSLPHRQGSSTKREHINMSTLSLCIQKL